MVDKINNEQEVNINLAGMHTILICEHHCTNKLLVTKVHNKKYPLGEKKVK